MDWKNAHDNEIVCYCKNINKKTIVDSILSDNTTLKAIKENTTACTGGDCKELNPTGKCCSGDIAEIISIYADKPKEEQKSCCGN